MRKRDMSAVLALLLALMLLFSALFIALEADHDCAGEDCAICAQISMCENLLQQLTLALLALAAAGVSCAAFSLLTEDLRERRAQTTLITLKVKLSD